MSAIDLICLSTGTSRVAWKAGKIIIVPPEAQAVASAVERLKATSEANAVLFWDEALGLPNEKLIQELAGLPVDCCHGGLKLGMGGLPGILDFISPTWMLAADPPPDIRATSWRLSLRACLVKMEVLRKLGGLQPGFHSLEVAALDMGYCWIRRGALMRHIPELIPTVEPIAEFRSPSLGVVSPPPDFNRQPLPRFSLEDEVRFAFYRFGRKWAGWAVFRAVMTGYTSLPMAVRAWRRVMSSTRPAEPQGLRQAEREDGRSKMNAGGFISDSSASNPFAHRVSILIPTVDRYPYLRTLLSQLRLQTVPPLEILVVDQTAPARRQPLLYKEFDDLPLKLIFQDEPGQCSSRNAGLQCSRGDYVLFIDDDDEVLPDLIEKHLQTLMDFRSDGSCGVAEEVGAGPLPKDFCLLRASDVFPTNNTMIRREVLRGSGLFDLAYNRRARADGDLGMRLYLSGALMVLNPAISVLHHHAPSGGLRKHKARTVTYAMSRNNILCRVLASASEIYLAGRYFPQNQTREMLWQSGLGTFSVRGSFLKKIAKLIVSTLLLPVTIRELRRRVLEAREITKSYPRIEMLSEASGLTGDRESESGSKNCAGAGAFKG